MTSYQSYIVEALCALVALAITALATVYAAQRIGVVRSSGALALRAQLVLDARRTIYVVTVGPHALVIGASDAGMTKLGEFPTEELPASPNPIAPPQPSLPALALARVRRRNRLMDTP